MKREQYSFAEQRMSRQRSVKNYTTICRGGARDRKCFASIPMWIDAPASGVLYVQGARVSSVPSPDATAVRCLPQQRGSRGKLARRLKVALPLEVLDIGTVIEWRLPRDGKILGVILPEPRWGGLPLPLEIQEMLIEGVVVVTPRIVEYVRRRLLLEDWTVAKLVAAAAAIHREDAAGERSRHVAA